MNIPKISVIVLVYNVEPYIARCVRSILEQDIADFEILLVVEERSVDRSVEICRQFAQKDSRIKICREDGTGFPAARNRGLDSAGGEFVAFVDADDYILPGMLSAMYDCAVRQKLDIVCCGGKKDSGNQRLADMDDYVKFSDKLYVVTPQNQRDYMYALAVNGRTVTAWGKLYRRDFLEENKLRFHPEAYSDDYVFNFACYTAASRVGTMARAYYVYYDRHDSRVYSSDTEEVKQSAKILWEMYRGYRGDAAEDVQAFAAVRIISSSLFNLKLKKLPIEAICKIIFDIVQALHMEPCLQRAGREDCFREYAQVMAMDENAAKNYLLFIRSLQSYDTVLAWQNKYAEMEKKGHT